MSKELFGGIAPTLDIEFLLAGTFTDMSLALVCRLKLALRRLEFILILQCIILTLMGFSFRRFSTVMKAGREAAQS